MALDESNGRDWPWTLASVFADSHYIGCRRLGPPFTGFPSCSTGFLLSLNGKAALSLALTKSRDPRTT